MIKELQNIYLIKNFTQMGLVDLLYIHQKKIKTY